MPSTFLHPDLTLDRVAIMRAAHAEARATLAKHAALGAKPWRYALALKHALKAVWSDARTYRQCAEQRARYAQADVRGRAIADLEAARFAAGMIDSTTKMLSAVASIDARLVELRAA